MSRARPKSQILATLWSVNRTFLAATSLWMHCRHRKHKHTGQTTPKRASYTWTIMTETKTLPRLRHRGWWQDQEKPWDQDPFMPKTLRGFFHHDYWQVWNDLPQNSCSQMYAQGVILRNSLHTIAHILGSQEVKTLSDLKGKLQEIINVQRPVNILLAKGVLVR